MTFQNFSHSWMIFEAILTASLIIFHLTFYRIGFHFQLSYTIIYILTSIFKYVWSLRKGHIDQSFSNFWAYSEHKFCFYLIQRCWKDCFLISLICQLHYLGSDSCVFVFEFEDVKCILFGISIWVNFSFTVPHEIVTVDRHISNKEDFSS